jgi:hypothetical protein
VTDDEARVLRDSVTHELRSIAPALRKTVAYEIRACALFGEPLAYHANPPRDLVAERSILASMWEGLRPPSFLKSEHFYSRGYSDAYPALLGILDAGLAPTVERMLVATGWAETQEAAEHSRGAARSEYETIAFGTPVTPIEPAARRVLALYHRRMALDTLLRAEALLRLDATSDADEVIELLRKVASEMNLMRQEPAATAVKA